MELGATVCLPRNPLCLLCPLEKVCRGKDHAEELPAKTRTRTVKETEQRALIKRHNTIWLLNPDAPGRWHGFYRLPPFDPQTMEKGKALGILRYTITHYRVAAEVLAAAWKTQAPPKGAWLSPKEIKSIALPSPHRKMLSLLPP
jgi:A/G-specific adenine glycosylase